MVRIFEQIQRPEYFSACRVNQRPAHKPVTQTVGRWQAQSMKGQKMNDKKSMLNMIILALIIFTLACSTLIPQTASTTPVSIAATSASTTVTNNGTVVTIQGIKLQITSATRQASYKNPITQKVYTPDNTQQDEVMVVEAKVLSGNTDIVSNWRDVWITDENGRKTSPGSVTTLADGIVIWPIVVQKSSRSFTLHLPGNVTIELNALIK